MNDQRRDKLSKDLYEAISTGNTAGFHQALRNGANVRNVAGNGWPPLYSACDVGNDEFVRILLNAGADPWWKNSEGVSDLSVACESGHLSIVEMLLNASRQQPRGNCGWSWVDTFAPCDLQSTIRNRSFLVGSRRECVSDR